MSGNQSLVFSFGAFFPQLNSLGNHILPLAHDGLKAVKKCSLLGLMVPAEAGFKRLYISLLDNSQSVISQQVFSLRCRCQRTCEDISKPGGGLKCNMLKFQPLKRAVRI